MSYVVGFLAGWFAYHLLMNRAVMMRRCCLDHFAEHPTCPCADCERERLPDREDV
jgi:hypothetical protein